MTITIGTERTSGGEMTNKRRESVMISVSLEVVLEDGIEAVEARHEEDARWYLTKKRGFHIVSDFEVLHGEDAVSEWARTHPEGPTPNDDDHHMLYQAWVTDDFWGWSDLDHKQLMSDLGIGGDAISAALNQGLELGKGSPGGLTEIWNIKPVDEEEEEE